MSSGFYQGKNQGKITKSISITSGKGGVGKTTIACNLAYHLSELGKKVLVFDGDVGMANADIMFGVRSNMSVHDVLMGDVSLADIIVPVTSNVSLIPGGSGIRELQSMNPFQRRSLMDEVSRLDRNYDYLIIDTAPGISDNVLYLNSAAQNISVIITPEPASFADSYALIKVLYRVHKVQHFSIICNLVEHEQEGLSLFKRFSDVVYRFLDTGLDYMGTIPSDVNLKKATYEQRLVVKQSPECPASIGLKNLVDSLERKQVGAHIRGGLEFFWEQMVGVA